MDFYLQETMRNNTEPLSCQPVKLPEPAFYSKFINDIISLQVPVGGRDNSKMFMWVGQQWRIEEIEWG